MLIGTFFQGGPPVPAPLMVLIGAFFQGPSHNFMDISSLLAMALICVLHPEQLCLQVPLMASSACFFQDGLTCWLRS